MNVFISQPMSGVPEDEILSVRASIFSHFRDEHPEAVMLGSYVDNGFMENANIVAHPEVFYLGQALEILSEADVILMAKGWEKARGCRIEHKVARYYDIPIVYA